MILTWTQDRRLKGQRILLWRNQFCWGSPWTWNQINVEDSSVKSFLLEQGTVWKFNMQLSSHMEGAFERLMGITRRILDSPLSSVFYWIGFIVDFVSKYPVHVEDQRSCRGFPWPGSRQYLYLTVEVCSTLGHGQPILDEMATWIPTEHTDPN